MEKQRVLTLAEIILIIALFFNVFVVLSHLIYTAKIDDLKNSYSPVLNDLDTAVFICNCDSENDLPALFVQNPWLQEIAHNINSLQKYSKNTASTAIYMFVFETRTSQKILVYPSSQDESHTYNSDKT